MEDVLTWVAFLAFWVAVGVPVAGIVRAVRSEPRVGDKRGGSK